MKQIRWTWACASAALALMGADSKATTFRSTRLCDLAELADAAVQGTVTLVESRLDASGLPWVLYTISIDNMLAGEAAGSELKFRCMGGPLGHDRLLQMVGAPVIELGDSLVFLDTSGGVCDVVGFEHGMFWIRSNTDGDARLVNYEGLAIGGFDAEGAIASDEHVPSAGQLASKVQAVPRQAGSEVRNFRPPAAELQPILDELTAFVAANVLQPERIDSVNGVADVPDLTPTPAPGATP